MVQSNKSTLEYFGHKLTIFDKDFSHKTAIDTKSTINGKDFGHTSTIDDIDFDRKSTIDDIDFGHKSVIEDIDFGHNNGNRHHRFWSLINNRRTLTLVTNRQQTTHGVDTLKNDWLSWHGSNNDMLCNCQGDDINICSKKACQISRLRFS